jgi:ribonuclease P protein component
VLPVAHRLRASADFTEVLRRGRRAGGRTLAVHLLPADASTEAPEPARAGLVVSKAVGGSVVRHQVARRLRHLLRDRITTVPGGTRLVVRAAPAAASASSATLGADLDRALSRTLDQTRSERARR